MAGVLDATTSNATLTTTLRTRGLGVALDDAHLAIAWPDSHAQRARWQSITTPCDGSPTSIVRALAQLAAEAPAANTTHVTLIRPLAHTRALRLPRMARATLEAILARDWTRHIIGHRNTPHTVTTRATAAGQWLAAFAPADLLDALADAGNAHNWHSVEVCTSDDVLASAARELAPDDARTGECVVVLCDGTGPTDAVRVRGGLPVLGRRFLRGADVSDIAAFLRGNQVDVRTLVMLLGHTTHTIPLTHALGAQGIRARATDLGLAASASAVELFAVAGTIGTAALSLQTPRAQHARSGRMRATTRWLVLATAAALILALGLERWRVQRDLSAVQRARADIAAPVRNAMAARSDVQNAADVAAALAEREAGASRVSGVLAAVALALPSNASLTNMHVAGDSVTVEGESPRSAAVYDALRSGATLEQVRLAAPLRQERLAGDVAIEHFAFSARVRHSAPLRRGATR